MIIDTKSIILTLVIVMIACYGGLQFIRQFALQIAQENHDAIRAMDEADNEARLKRERAAEAASESAFAKVKPILTQEKNDGIV
jgi:cell division protein FtsL